MAGQPRTRAKKALAALEQESPAADAGDEGARTSGDRPPRASAGRGGTSPPHRASPVPSDRRPQGIRKIEESLTASFVTLGLGLSMVDLFDGQVIALNAERLARSWSDLAAQNATVRKYLERAMQGGAWGAAIGSTAMVAVPILVRHGMAPVDLAVMAAGNGVRIPDVFQDAAPAPIPGQDFPPVDTERTPETEAEDIDAERAAHAPVRHPLDGSPVAGDPFSLPSEPIAFPVDASSGMNGAA